MNRILYTSIGFILGIIVALFFGFISVVGKMNKYTIKKIIFVLFND